LKNYDSHKPCMPEQKRTAKTDCPFESLEIEQCPAFLIPKKAKLFPCPHKRDCESETIGELGSFDDLSLT